MLAEEMCYYIGKEGHTNFKVVNVQSTQRLIFYYRKTKFKVIWVSLY